MTWLYLEQLSTLFDDIGRGQGDARSHGVTGGVVRQPGEECVHSSSRCSVASAPDKKLCRFGFWRCIEINGGRARLQK